MLKSVQFRREREADWKRLERLLDRVEKSGTDGLSFDESLAFTRLYRQALSSLSVAREISLDRGTRRYLEALSSRAYGVMYTRPKRAGEAMIAFFLTGFPRAVCTLWPALMLSIGVFTAGALLGFWLMEQDVVWLNALLGPEAFQGRGPEDSQADLLRTVYDDGNLAQRTSGWEQFALSLMINNIGVALMCFALGVAGGLPTLALLLYNGLVIGMFYQVFHDKGIGPDIIAWLSIHGVTELSAIILAGAAGIHIGQSVLFPGRESRTTRMRQNGQRAADVIMGAALLLILAGFVEGFFRQAVNDASTRLIIGYGLGGLLWGYIATGGWWQALLRRFGR